MNENKNKNKVGGSVLFTVISVMMVMTVLVFAALTLAASANRRVHNSYANNQTQYTARSVIESICEAMESSSGFRSRFVMLETKGQSIDIEVQLPGNDASMGTIVGNPTVTLLGTGNDYGYASDKNMYKITATVKMAGQENTVSGYFLAERIDNSMPFNYALVALESNGAGDNMGVMGGASVGVNGISNWQILNQNASIQSPVNVNGGVSVAANAHLLLSRPSEGIYAGDYLTFANAGHVVQSDMNLDMNDNLVIDEDERINYKELPYIYVGKQISFADRYEIASTSNPVILMADSLASPNKGSYLYGDVYLYAESDHSSDFFLSLYDTGVRQWDTGIVKKKDNSSGQTYTGGNVYSMGHLDVLCDSGSVGLPFEFANNVVADSINLNASAVTDGAVVSRSFNVQNSAIDASFEKGLFIIPDNLVHTNGTEEVYSFKINGQQYTPPNYAVRDVLIYEGESDTIHASDFSGEVVDLDWNKYYYNIEYDLTSLVPTDADKVIIEPEIEINASPNYQSPEITMVQYANVRCYFRKFMYLENDYNVYEQLHTWASDKDQTISMNAPTILNGFQLDTSKSKGMLSLSFEPDAWENVNKQIRINSISVKFKISAYKTEQYIESQVDNRGFLRSINDVAFTNNGNIICIDDIDKSVKLEKYDDGYGGYELKISKADLSVIEEGYECDPTKVNYTEVGVYDYDNLESYAEFLRAVVDTVTFPDSMKKVDKPNTIPAVRAPEIVDTSFLEWTSYDDASGNPVNISKQEYEAKIQTDKAFDHISETENLVYDFSIGNGKMNIYEGGVLKAENVSVAGYEVTSSCTFKGGLVDKAIRISPSADNIYIKIGEFCNFGQTTIIVDDDNGKKKVNFLLEADQSFFTQAVLMTKTYEEMYNAGTFDIMQNPMEQKYVPGVYFFSEYKTGNTTTLTVFNDAVITGYIMAPTAYFSVPKPLGMPYKYVTNELYLDDDGSGNTVIKSDKISEVNMSGIAVIGGIIAQKTGLANNPGCLYVNPNAILEVKGEKEISLTEYECLYYQAY